MSYESDYSEYSVELEARLVRRYGRKWAREHGVPSAEDTPTAFRRWLLSCRDRSAALRGDFPRRGRGWVFVSAV